MATMLFAATGTMLGTSLSGIVGGKLGSMLGMNLGKAIDMQVFGSNTKRQASQGYRMKNLSIQTSGYGHMIPIIYGVVKITGHIIWTMPIREVENKHTQVIKRGKGSKIRHDHTSYSYFASFAISLCEGEIDEVLRIFANDEQINPSNYRIRIYKGTKDQMPDPLIEGKEGLGKTPAFRNQAYVVFENLPLSEFGNIIPNFSFEIKKSVSQKNEPTISNLLKSIVVIPGGGEYVYDTIAQYKSIGTYCQDIWCPQGHPTPLNVHASDSKTNAVIAVEKLKNELPNVKWVSVVVNWFATSTDIASCKILPGVEYRDDGVQNFPDAWNVGRFSRVNAHLISKINNRPSYGGTINDASLQRYIKHLKDNGFKVLLYPMLFVDNKKKDWRGYITGRAGDITEFFQQYCEFIMHYCNLCPNLIDSFIIGSEYKGITSIKDANNQFLGVKNFANIAKMCKEILPPSVKVSYAADWSEYHHTEGGWYHMDELWSSKYIDYIGIDAYFPLSNSGESIYDINEIQKGWHCGLGHDFYYDENGQMHALSANYAWKNIKWWWENQHINPDGNATGWQPMSKKIWFTEYGFPSVDCATNEPNVFFDPEIHTANFPKNSKGFVDYKAQKSAIIATELAWLNSDMVENKFLWCWDARPYPYWPDLLNVWSDGDAWRKGHWIQGKNSNSSLSGVLRSIANIVGLSGNNIVFERISQDISGMVIDSITTAADVISSLQQVYNFHIVEKEGQISFCSNNLHSVRQILSSDIAHGPGNEYAKIMLSRKYLMDLPARVMISYIDYTNNYQVQNQYAQHHDDKNSGTLYIDLPIALSPHEAKNVVHNLLDEIYSAQNQYSFYLGANFIDIKPADIIKIDGGDALQVTKVYIGKNNLVHINAINCTQRTEITDSFNLLPSNLECIIPIGQIEVLFFDLPYIPIFKKDAPYILCAVTSTSKNFNGCSIYYSSTENANFQKASYISSLATFGKMVATIENTQSPSLYSDDDVIVNLEYGELLSIDKAKWAENMNLCLIGSEVVQFEEAILIAPYQYKLSRIHRGLYGTYGNMTSHKDGEVFLLLNEDVYEIEIPKHYIGQSLYFKALRDGVDDISNVKERGFAPLCNALRPNQCVHLRICEDKILHWSEVQNTYFPITDYITCDIAKDSSFLVHIIDKSGNLLNSIQTSDVSLKIDYQISELSQIKVAQVKGQMIGAWSVLDLLQQHKA